MVQRLFGHFISPPHVFLLQLSLVVLSFQLKYILLLILELDLAKGSNIVLVYRWNVSQEVQPF